MNKFLRKSLVSFSSRNQLVNPCQGLNSSKIGHLDHQHLKGSLITKPFCERKFSINNIPFFMMEMIIVIRIFDDYGDKMTNK